MGLLAPLYALAALAIIGPIVLHLIRRQPQGQIPFSSLMFLRTSPPRLTRRSRLDNLLLLLLRGLALMLIALAFSRPYWRQKELVGQTGPSRTVALLMDVSASMQRSEVWQAAIKESERVLADLGDQDQIALYTIDNQLTPIVSVEEFRRSKQSGDAAALKSLVVDSLQKLRPTWNGSKLSVGLMGLADLLNSSGLGSDSTAASNSQIILVSDFHIDSGLDELQGYAWPKQIEVDLRIVGQDQPGNARASLMQSDDASLKPVADVKIRIENNAHSQLSNFNLQWTDQQGSAIGPSTAMQVTPGQVRVVTMPVKPDRAQQVQLSGDGWSGDNTVFVPSSQQFEQRVVYCGSQGNKPEEDLSYFLSQAPLSTQIFRRQVTVLKPNELNELSQAEDVLAVVIEPTEEILTMSDSLRTLAKRGVSVVMVLTEQSAKLTGIEPFLASMLSADSAEAGSLEIKLSESQSKEHAMIAFVDYRSSVFASLADPRFNDFSKIRIWKHRQVSWNGLQTNEDLTDQTATRQTATNDESVLPAMTSTTGPATAGPEVLARLDDQSPWLARTRLGNGNVWLLTSGWQTSESSFALSSKFIPVAMSLLDSNPRATGFARVVEVGELVELEDSPPYVITNQLGQTLDSQLANTSNKFQFTEPGLYNIRGDRWNQQLSVQLAPNESRLTPLDSSLLQQFGMTTDKLESDAEIQDRLRQMKIEELEEQQRLWKWLLVAGLGVLLLETFVAGKQA